MARAVLDARLRLNTAEFSGGLSRAVRESSVAVSKMSAQFGSLRNVLTGGAVGTIALGFAKDMFQATMEAEKLTAALSATAGSIGLGKLQLEEVRKLAGEVGVDVKSAAKAMIQFQSAGMSAGDAMRTISAGFNAILSTGGGQAEFSRFAVAIQQLRTSPKVLQEELNQLREALPTTARLMQETFGAQRAEDIQKLGISGREFVDAMLLAMEKLPQIGDTMEKQIGRLAAKWQELKASAGDLFRPAAEGFIDESQSLIEGTKREIEGIGELMDWIQGKNLEAIRTKEDSEELSARIAQMDKERAASEAAFRDSALKEEKLNLAAKEKSIEQGKALAGIYSKFEDIFKKAAEAAREFRDSLNFEDKMREFMDADRENAWDQATNDTRDAVTKNMERIRGERDAKKWDALEIAEGVAADERRRIWEEKINEAGMTPNERQDRRASDRARKRATDRAINKEARDRIRQDKEETRKRAFDDAKKGIFHDPEEAKKRIKDQVRKEADDATKKSAMTLSEILTVLKTLATA